MSVLLSFGLYFLSFAPLWLSVVFIDAMSIVKGSPNVYTEYISISLIILVFVVCLVVMLIALSSKNRDGAQKYVLHEIKEDKMITAEFLLSYILPLFAFNFTVWEQVILFLVFFVIFGLLCIRHNYFCVNIILELAGYRFYQCNMTNEDGIYVSKTVISRERLNGHVNEEAVLRALNNDIVFDITKWCRRGDIL